MDLTEEELLEAELGPPNIHDLFVHYNSLYFEDKLGACSVEWSSARMTLCGGVCEWRPGGGCRIKLSEPLLKLRPSRDLKMVLLHEMVHAFMMLQGIRDDDAGGHGTIFKSIMKRINDSQLPDHQRPAGGYHITVTHSMFAEVDHYRQHHWRCERCGNLVKRAMNRPPQEADCRGRMGKGAACQDPDCRYHMHIKHCGGSWVKIKEPEGYGQKKGRRKGGGSGSEDTGGARAGAGGNKGASSSSTAARPDGAPLPAKRPRKSRSGAAAAAAGVRDIRGFFGAAAAAAASAASAAAAPPLLVPAAAAEAAVAAAPDGDDGSSKLHGASGGRSSNGTLPAIAAAVAASAAATAAAEGPCSQQQQQQQREAAPDEPSADERRRLLAEAAMRRLGGGGRPSQAQQQTPQQQHHQQQCQPLSQRQPTQQTAAPSTAAQAVPWLAEKASRPAGRPPPADVVDLLDSPDELSALLAARWLQRRERDTDIEAGAPTEAAAGGGSTGAAGAQQQAGALQQRAAATGDAEPCLAPAGGSGSGQALECPVCGQRWSAGQLTNAELNCHVDECLNLSFLQEG